MPQNYGVTTSHIVLCTCHWQVKGQFHRQSSRILTTKTQSSHDQRAPGHLEVTGTPGPRDAFRQRRKKIFLGTLLHSSMIVPACSLEVQSQRCPVARPWLQSCVNVTQHHVRGHLSRILASKTWSSHYQRAPGHIEVKTRTRDILILQRRSMLYQTFWLGGLSPNCPLAQTRRQSNANVAPPAPLVPGPFLQRLSHKSQPAASAAVRPFIRGLLLSR